MPKAKPVSLHPLTFDEAVKALIRADPERVQLTKPKKTTRRPPKKSRSKPSPT